MTIIDGLHGWRILSFESVQDAVCVGLHRKRSGARSGAQRHGIVSLSLGRIQGRRDVFGVDDQESKPGLVTVMT
jgi:hypothetical protein